MPSGPRVAWALHKYHSSNNVPSLEEACLREARANEELRLLSYIMLACLTFEAHFHLRGITEENIFFYYAKVC